jgi:hypothetical protein
MCNISYNKSFYSPTKKYLNNLKFKHTFHNTILCRVGLMQSHSTQLHGVHAKAGCISLFVSKYILYASSYISISAISALEYAYVVGPQDLFLYWAQKCLKKAPILNINDLGMWKKGLNYQIEKTFVYIALSITVSRCKKVRYCASKQDSATVHKHLNAAECFMAI